MLEAGKFNKQVELWGVASMQRQGGDMVNTPYLVDTLRANIEPLSGQELLLAQQIRAQTSHRITIRYRRGLNKRNFFKFEGRCFHIVSIIDPGEKHEELVVTCASNPEAELET